MADLRFIRTALVVPLSSERLLSRVHERGADAVVLDLEDGVAPGLKSAARNTLLEWAARPRSHECAWMVRVNNTRELLELDLRACADAGISCVVLPKAESPEALATVDGVLEKLEHDGAHEAFAFSVVAGIESPRAVVNSVAIARHPRVAGLVFGSEDYCATLGIPSDVADLAWPAQQIAVAAAAAERASFGVPGTITDYRDDAAFERLVRRGRAMGFTGCMGIHPAQIAAARRAFLPTSEEVDLALEIVRAAETGEYRRTGVTGVRGRMVDAPVLAQALKTLQLDAGAPGAGLDDPTRPRSVRQQIERGHGK